MKVFTESDSRKPVIVHSEWDDDTLEEYIESETLEGENCTVGDIMKQMRINHESKRAELKSLKKDITVMQESMQFLPEAFEDTNSLPLNLLEKEDTKKLVRNLID
ncbi:hypothetical protein WA026_004997 [Henosepilachna vigintioctopunctata]|uniref:Uncharacterized protein n=1 Tax=Henosepilachna vigintioctopunctata TaxID=420089 RepID=A0AAW1UVS1_9CUCU